MLCPGLEKYCQLAQEGGVVPVYADVIDDEHTPTSLYRKLSNDAPSYLLESVAGGTQVARHSFIGIDPFATFTLREDHTKVTGLDNLELPEDPFDALRAWIDYYTPGQQTLDFVREHLPPFFGGAVGYLSYEMAAHIEDIPVAAGQSTDIPDSQFIMSRLVAAFDHATNRIKLIVNTLPGQDPEDAYRCAEETVRKILRRMDQPLPPSEERPPPTSFEPSSNMQKEAFTASVERARDYIRAGDIFQVVLSQRLQIPLRTSSFTVYRHLRSVNPSPYTFHLNLPDVTLVGSSPELLVRVVDQVVETRPLAGTQPRGHDDAEDQLLEEKLRNDEKERAEHIMLVDLGRNDIGRVAKYGSVRVPELIEVERYSHVMHLVSHVKGELRPDKDAIDALKACFPAGTLTGAPKLRAMEIIAEMEPDRRGPYGGAVGYLGFSGNLDSCIIIRTVVIKDGRAYVQAGAGIVADSEPQSEYHETLNKADALLAALKQAEGSMLP